MGRGQSVLSPAAMLPSARTWAVKPFSNKILEFLTGDDTG